MTWCTQRYSKNAKEKYSFNVSHCQIKFRFLYQYTGTRSWDAAVFCTLSMLPQETPDTHLQLVELVS